jgi:uncharacterized protein (TIGR03000 family)
MRHFLLVVAAVLLGNQLAMAAPPVSVKPYVPPQPKPTPPMGIPALNIYPDLPTYFASAFFYQDFPRRYAEMFPLALVPMQPLQPLPLAPEDDPARAKVTLQVPETAEVFIDGEKLKLNGAQREFYSPPLPEGQRFAYQVLVRWSDGQRPLERKLSVTVGRGEKPMLLVMNPLAK